MLIQKKWFGHFDHLGSVTLRWDQRAVIRWPGLLCRASVLEGTWEEEVKPPGVLVAADPAPRSILALSHHITQPGHPLVPPHSSQCSPVLLWTSHRRVVLSLRSRAPPLSYSLRHLPTIRQRADTSSDPRQLGFGSRLCPQSFMALGQPKGLVGQLSQGEGRGKNPRQVQPCRHRAGSRRHVCSRGRLRVRRGILFSLLPARSAVPPLLGVELGWCWHGAPHIQSETSGFAA